MIPDDVDNYLAEISRVMKPEGKCFVTYFLINDEIAARMKNGCTNFVFAFPYGDCLLMDRNVKESNVAFKEDFLEGLYLKHGLECTAKYYGKWSNSPGSFFFQDIEILVKKQSRP
jgi:ubiquinone/menaquinone biosynthesis C-methylase UbiE